LAGTLAEAVLGLLGDIVTEHGFAVQQGFGHRPEPFLTCDLVLVQRALGAEGCNRPMTGTHDVRIWSNGIFEEFEMDESQTRLVQESLVAGRALDVG